MVKEIAKETAKDCTTCKMVAAKFAALVEKYGKENAVLIQSAAKEIVKASVAYTKDAAKDARTALANGSFVARAAWLALLNEDRQGAQFARLVYEHCGCNLGKVVTEFASYVTKVGGNDLAVVKYVSKDEDGNKVVEYKPRNLDAVGGYLAALKLAVNNAKRDALGEPRAKWQTKVSASSVIGI
ncbi:MAG: hypothetical protein J6T35_01995 [Bacteroidales bacterium]|nr:hypothetical protein [Bacteroidales bacterium]